MDNYEKKYMEARSRAKNLHKDAVDMGETILAKQCEIIFPELKENEGERIRKMLIAFFSNGAEYNSFTNGISDKDIIEWLEKQGEQKSIDKIKHKFKVGDKIKTTNEESLIITKIDKKGYWSEDLFICDFDEECLWDLVEQNPANRVKPKFHIGDYLVNDYCKGKVIALTDDAYLLDTEQDIPFSYEHNAHLWTIKDAEDGDVLIGDNGSIILMFRGIGNTEWNDVIDYHCYYDCYQECFIVQEDLEHWGNIKNNQLKPATKEQCGLLFQKMKEVGYEWNAEKKELKKIEQKPAIEMVTPEESLGLKVQKGE